MDKRRRQIIEGNEISEIWQVTLGGYQQKVMIDGRYRNNPIVICLHGGPGTPIPFNVGSRGLFPEVTEQLTLVCWDQLGSGANDHVIDDNFHIDDFVSMTVELVAIIRDRFPDHRIFLFAMSWGSILAAKALSRIGDRIQGVITYGQVLHHMVFNEEVFLALEKSAMSEKKKELLNNIKTEQTMDNASRIMAWLRKYTNAYNGNSAQKTPVWEMLKGYLTSPDYRLRDCKAIILNGYKNNKTLMQELLTVDVREHLLATGVPYVIIQGSLDLVTSTGYIKEFLSGCKNRNIRLVVVEEEGHMPNPKGMDAILEEIVKISHG